MCIIGLAIVKKKYSDAHTGQLMDQLLDGRYVEIHMPSDHLLRLTDFPIVYEYRQKCIWYKVDVPGVILVPSYLNEEEDDPHTIHTTRQTPKNRGIQTVQVVQAQHHLPWSPPSLQKSPRQILTMTHPKLVTLVSAYPSDLGS